MQNSNCYIYRIQITKDGKSVSINKIEPDNENAGNRTGKLKPLKINPLLPKWHATIEDGTQPLSFQNIGQELYELLLNELSEDLEWFYNKACEQKAFLRIELEIDEYSQPISNWARLPWEFLVRPGRDAGGKFSRKQLAVDPNLSFVRYQPHPSSSALRQPKLGEKVRLIVAGPPVALNSKIEKLVAPIKK